MTLGTTATGSADAELRQASSREADAAGVRLHYHDVGEGPPVVLLHGGGPGAGSWDNFARNTPAFAERHRLLLVDMPQFGRSAKVPLGGPRLTRTADILLALLDGLGVERADFVGNSMGGQVAARLAINAPDRIRRLVLIGSAPIPYATMVPQPLEGIKLLRDYYAGDGPSTVKMRRLLETIVHDRSIVTDPIVEARYRASIDPDLVRLQAAGNLFEPENLLGELDRVLAPTLIVWGQDDRFGALDVGLFMLRAFRDARMHVFGHCGHWAQVERADEFNRLVLDFLDAA